MTDNAANPRAARESDIPFLAAMADEAVRPPFPRSFWAIAGEAAGLSGLDVLAAAMRHDAFLWGRTEQFLVLEEGGAPAASCAVFSAAELRAWPADPEKLAAALQAEGVAPDPAASVASALRGILAGVEASPFAIAPAAAIVENVGVAPERRGRGLVRPLFEAAYVRARDLRADEIGLSVVLTNTAARRAYERLGFETTAEYGPEHFGFDGFPGVAKMRRAI